MIGSQQWRITNQASTREGHRVWAATRWPTSHVAAAGKSRAMMHRLRYPRGRRANRRSTADGTRNRAGNDRRWLWTYPASHSATSPACMPWNGCVTTSGARCGSPRWDTAWAYFLHRCGPRTRGDPEVRHDVSFWPGVGVGGTGGLVRAESPRSSQATGNVRLRLVEWCGPGVDEPPSVVGGDGQPGAGTAAVVGQQQRGGVPGGVHCLDLTDPATAVSG